MYKFQFRPISTGEIVETEYIYRFPYTAKKGAHSYLTEQLNRGYLSKSDGASFRVIDEKFPNDPVEGFSTHTQSLFDLNQWLRRYTGR